MSATPTDKHCIEWCNNCVELCSMAASTHKFYPTTLTQTSPAWNCAANIQHFFDMTKDYCKNINICTKKGNFL